MNSYEKLSDSELIDKCFRKELDAFGELYTRYVRKIYAYFFRRTLNKEGAEDLTSATFLKALAGIANFNPARGPFGAWLYSIAGHNLIDFYRRAKKTEGLEQAENVSDGVDVEKEIHAKAELERARGYLEELPAEQKNIILMRVLDGLSFKEIAGIIGKSEPAAKMAFGRAVRKIRAKFSPSLN